MDFFATDFLVVFARFVEAALREVAFFEVTFFLADLLVVFLEADFAGFFAACFLAAFLLPFSLALTVCFAVVTPERDSFA